MPVIYCDSCETKIPRHYNYCPFCGNSLGEGNDRDSDFEQRQYHNVIEGERSDSPENPPDYFRFGTIALLAFIGMFGAYFIDDGKLLTGSMILVVGAVILLCLLVVSLEYQRSNGVFGAILTVIMGVLLMESDMQVPGLTLIGIVVLSLIVCFMKVVLFSSRTRLD